MRAEPAFALATTLGLAHAMYGARSATGQLGPPADDVTFLPLWVELYRDGGRELVDGCGFSEIEDAVDERCGCSST